MNKTVYLVRHCQATGKESKAELTEKGQEQARELISFFKDRNIKQIISSPMKRAIQSVQPLANNLGKQIKIDDRLSEHKLMSKDLKDWLDRIEDTLKDQDLKMVDGESSRKIAARGMEVLEAAQDGTILSTHRNTMALLLIKLNGAKEIIDWTKLSKPDVYEVKKENDTYIVKRIWE